MRSIKRLVAVLAAALALGAPAFAADLGRPIYKSPPPVVVTPSFAGWYVGLQGGYGFSEDSMSFAGTDAIGQIVVATGAVPGSLKTEAKGWNIGGVAGYNWQPGAFLFGVEASLNWSDISGSQSNVLSVAPLGLPVSLATTASQELDWYGRLVGRIGVVVFDRALLFFDGGAAYGGVKNSASITLNAPAPIGASVASLVDDNKFGWTIGAGIEAALLDGWRVKAAWEYLDFGSETLALNANVLGAPVSFRADQENKFHVAKIGLIKGF